MAKHSLSKYELFSTITHLVGLCLTVSMTWVIIWLGYAKNWEMAFGATFFTIGMILMYLASTLYHFWTPNTRGKRVLQLLDHISIYVLIACSYTPVCMALVEENQYVSGWVSFGCIWFIAILGIFYKIFFWRKFPRLSLILYIILGWAVIFIAKPVSRFVSPLALSFILAEGLSYTGGIYFFAKDDKNIYYHGWWHIFVILGTLFHWAAVFVLALNP